MIVAAIAPETVSALAFALAGAVLGHVAFSAFLARVERADEPADSLEPGDQRFALELGMIFLLGLLGSRLIAGAVIAALTRETGAPPELETSLLLSLAANAAIVAIAILLARRRGRTARDGIGWRETTSRTAFRGFAVGVFGLLAASPAFFGAAQLNARILDIAGVEPLQQSVRQLIADRDLLTSAEILAGIGIIGPFLEEVLFRGLLLRALLVAMSPARAITVSALVFALVHDVPSMLPVFVLGLVFGALYLRTRSIAAPFFAHLSFNLAQLCFVIPTAS